MPNLIVERGREKGQSFDLATGATVVVGRDPATAQIVIADAGASRRHFQLSQRSGRWFVADLGSKNATYVNEERIEREVELAPGDRVQVGETVFTFNDDQKVEDKAAGLTGKEIGGYRILERVGRGGMGTVFKAKQISLNRLVALKFLSPKLSKDPSFVEKFFAEARAAAQLNHPNVVQVFDVGTLSGVHFFSMEFMEGGCVQDLLTAREDSRLPWQDALPLVTDAVRGLVFAEKRGIIHRDIKPDNLMLTSEQKVKIGDLGLATSVEGGTEKGIFGTPHFIAPEQAQGRDVTHAADLYSLGATFYRMVSGRTPFSGTTVKEILRAQINDPHVPLVTEVPGFPPELSAIADRLMAKKVEERYQSATKLLEDLEAFQLAHQIELAGGVKSRKPFLVALGVLAAALAGLGIYVATREEKKGEPQIITRTVEVEKDPGGTLKTEEDLRREAESAVSMRYLQIKVKDTELREISLDKRTEWDEVQKLYDGLGGEMEKRFPNLEERFPTAKETLEQARARAKAIRVRLDELETLQNTVVRAAKEWWTATQDDLKAKIGLESWGDAIRAAFAAAGGEDLKRHLPHLSHLTPPAADWLAGVPAECFAEASRRHQETLDGADATLKAGDPATALRSVEDWEKLLHEQDLEREDDVRWKYDARWKGLAESARQWRESKLELVQTQRREQLGFDRVVFVEAWRSVRHWPNPPTPEDSGGLVWSYRFREAAAAIRAACEGRVKTDLYVQRLNGTAGRLEAAQAAFEDFVKLLNERKVFAPGEEIHGVPGVAEGARVSLDLDRPATASEVALVVAIAGGNAKRTLPWADLEPAELFATFVAPHVADRLPPDVALGLARMFALLGVLEPTQLCYDRGRTAGEDTAWIEAEMKAMQDREIVVEGQNMTPADRRRAVDRWRKEHLRTDFFVLADGRPVSEMPHLWSDEEVERFVESVGR